MFISFFLLICCWSKRCEYLRQIVKIGLLSNSGIIPKHPKNFKDSQFNFFLFSQWKPNSPSFLLLNIVFQTCKYSFHHFFLDLALKPLDFYWIFCIFELFILFEHNKPIKTVSNKSFVSFLINFIESGDCFDFFDQILTGKTNKGVHKGQKFFIRKMTYF